MTTKTTKWNKDAAGTEWMTVNGWTYTVIREGGTWKVYVRHPIEMPTERLVGAGHETIRDAKASAEMDSECLCRREQTPTEKRAVMDEYIADLAARRSPLV